MDAKGRCVSCRQDKRAARKYRWKVIGGLIFPFALQALDVTMSVFRGRVAIPCTSVESADQPTDCLEPLVA